MVSFYHNFKNAFFFSASSCPVGFCLEQSQKKHTTRLTSTMRGPIRSTKRPLPLRQGGLRTLHELEGLGPFVHLIFASPISRKDVANAWLDILPLHSLQVNTPLLPCRTIAGSKARHTQTHKTEALLLVASEAKPAQNRANKGAQPVCWVTLRQSRNHPSAIENTGAFAAGSFERETNLKSVGKECNLLVDSTTRLAQKPRRKERCNMSLAGC